MRNGKGLNRHKTCVECRTLNAEFGATSYYFVKLNNILYRVIARLRNSSFETGRSTFNFQLEISQPPMIVTALVTIVPIAQGIQRDNNC